MKTYKIWTIAFIIAISLISLGIYLGHEKIETRKDFVITGTFIGCGLWQIYILNNGTTLDNGYVVRISNATIDTNNLKYKTSQTEYWFSSLGSYNINSLNALCNQIIKISYHTNSKDKIVTDSIIDSVEVYE